MVLYLLVGGGIVLSAAAQIFLKISAINEVRDYRWLLLVITSMFFYGLAFLVYSFVLKHFPISTISPIMTVGTVALVVASGVLMGESLTMGQITGLFFGIISIILILT